MARVLVVDDHENILMMLESILQEHGHAVTCVNNPIDAIDKLDTFPFDLVISDIVMPGRSTGVDLVRAMRANKKLASLPVIMLSGRRGKEDIEKSIQAGADDYIVKPVDPDVLMAKIESLLVKKNPNATRFVDAAVNENFLWDVKNEIVRISEVGLTIHSTLAIGVGTKVKLKGAFLENMNLQYFQHRIVSCQKVSAEVTYYTIKTQFIGLTEAMLQPLRLWIRSNQTKAG